MSFSMNYSLKASLLSVLLFISNLSIGYSQLAGQDTSRRVITTAVQFLMISPDARAAGMGDLGAAVSPDANTMHWNIAKMAFVEKDMGFSLSYTPWLQSLVDDMWISYLAGYKKLSKYETVGMSLRYFNMGELQFTDEFGNPVQVFNPNEFALDVNYARQLSEYLSIGGAIRFIHSNLSGNFSNSSSSPNSKPGNTAAVDVGLYYKKPLSLSSMNSDLTFGLSISNVGAKISYTNPEQKDFIPTNLRLGAAFNGEIDEFNKFTLSLEFNKLLVPTPPLRNVNGDIIGGKDPNRGLISAIVGSFGDAPDGISEELKEVIIAVGGEYWYNNILSIRGGYFNEHKEKGNRQYFTAGLGVRYQVFAADFAYLIPKRQQHPLANTMRFTLSFNFGGKDKFVNSSDPTDSE